MTRSHPSDNANLFQFMPSDQMEADSRMFYTLLRHNNIYIRKVNSISICIAVKLAFTSLRLTEFWVSFGSGKRFQTISIHAIVKITWSPKVHLTPTLLYLLQ